jgi:hypothetical protein
MLRLYIGRPDEILNIFVRFYRRERIPDYSKLDSECRLSGLRRQGANLNPAGCAIDEKKPQTLRA